MVIGGERRALCSGELAQWDDGSCLGHGFRLSLRKAAFEPHVSLLKIVMSLSSPRNILEPTSLLPCRLSHKKQLPYATHNVQRLSRAAPWASLVLTFPPPSLDCNPGKSIWVGLVPQPISPVHNDNKPPTHRYCGEYFLYVSS